MRATRWLLIPVALLALAGQAAALNDPCPECDGDGNATTENSYHSIDVGVIEDNSTEVLGDTDMAYGHAGDPKGFWGWISICLSAFFQAIADKVGVQTDVDANVEVYADSHGVDVDASTHGLQKVCAAAKVNMTCDQDFDKSAVGHLDGKTFETVAKARAATGVRDNVPAVLPDTGDDDTDVCVKADLRLC